MGNKNSGRRAAGCAGRDAADAALAVALLLGRIRGAGRLEVSRKKICSWSVVVFPGGSRVTK